ncbi:MAG: hypothetical protein AABX65_02810 [Nanoarchaeota archaeon]
MAADITGLAYFIPILGFLFVFVMSFAVLVKTKILGESAFVNVFISFILAIIFATVSSARQYVTAVMPWFVVLLIAIFFISLLIGMAGKKVDEFLKPGFIWVFVVLLLVIFIIAAINVFSFNFTLYIPAKLLENRIFGAVLLLIIAAITAWILTKKDGK